MLTSNGFQTDAADLVLSLFPVNELAASLSAPTWLPLGWAALPYPKGLNLVRVFKKPREIPRCDLHVLVLPKSSSTSLLRGQIARERLPQFSCLFSPIPDASAPPGTPMPTQYKLLKFVTTVSEVLEVLSLLQSSEDFSPANPTPPPPQTQLPHPLPQPHPPPPQPHPPHPPPQPHPPQPPLQPQLQPPLQPQLQPPHGSAPLIYSTQTPNSSLLPQQPPEQPILQPSHESALLNYAIETPKGLLPQPSLPSSSSLERRQNFVEDKGKRGNTLSKVGGDGRRSLEDGGGIAGPSIAGAGILDQQPQEKDGIICQDAKTGEIFFVPKPVPPLRRTKTTTNSFVAEEKRRRRRVIIPCVECRNSFGSQSEYEAHVVKAYRSQINLVDISGNHYRVAISCRICGALSQDPARLVVHFAQCHPEAKPLQCAQCRVDLAGLTELHDHLEEPALTKSHLYLQDLSSLLWKLLLRNGLLEGGAGEAPAARRANNEDGAALQIKLTRRRRRVLAGRQFDRDDDACLIDIADADTGGIISAPALRRQLLEFEGRRVKGAVVEAEAASVGAEQIFKGHCEIERGEGGGVVIRLEEEGQPKEIEIDDEGGARRIHEASLSTPISLGIPGSSLGDTVDFSFGGIIGGGYVGDATDLPPSSSLETPILFPSSVVSSFPDVAGMSDPLVGADALTVPSTVAMTTTWTDDAVFGHPLCPGTFSLGDGAAMLILNCGDDSTPGTLQLTMPVNPGDFPADDYGTDFSVGGEEPPADNS